MSLVDMKISSVLCTILFVCIAFKLSYCEAQSTNDSASNNDSSVDTTRLLRRAYKKKKILVERINLFFVTFPCTLLFAFVFVCYIFIYKQQRLHGWIVLAITGSLCLRFGVIFLIDLPVFYFYWKSSQSFQGLCVTYGERPSRTCTVRV